MVKAGILQAPRDSPPGRRVQSNRRSSPSRADTPGFLDADMQRLSDNSLFGGFG
jgi:hypothetical protein